MSDIAIRVESLSKAYRIGLAEQRHETLLGAVASFIKSPLKNYRDLRKLSRFDDAIGKDQGSRIKDQGVVSFGAPPQSSILNPSSSAPPPPSDVIWALRDVSFEVKHGEVVGIIGRNGAGKSTLLKILSRITEPTRGRAEVFGRVGSLLEVGTGFHPGLTGRENVYLNGTILGMKKREVDAKFDEIVEFSGVEKFIDTPVKRYSSGMRVRLAFSVAAHLEPEILVIDEVLSVGDAEFQKKCLGKMHDVAGHGRTVLFVSHNLTAVQSLCQRGVWLQDGRLTLDDTASRVVASYLQSGDRLVNERRWDDPQSAPGNGEVRIMSARVHSPGAPEMLSIDAPVDLEFEILNLVPGAVLNLSYHLFRQDGSIAFNSFSTERPLPKGSCKFTCRIPEHLLNDGTYFVELLVVRNSSSVICKLQDCLSFEIHDLDRHGGWYGEYPGSVRPRLNWTIEQAHA